MYCEGFERVHGGQGYGVMNESRDSILKFAITYDLIQQTLGLRKGLTLNYFRKRDKR